MAPDFAYPRTVVTDSRRALDKAVRDGDPQLTLRALMDMEIASMMISADSIGPVLELISETTGGMKDPVGRALGLMLQADIYRQIYSANRWKYDQRELPDEPLDDDCRLWSGKQFRRVVEQLCDSALAYSADMQSEPIDRYDKVIDVQRTSRPYYPTVYDFVATKAIDIITDVNQLGRRLPDGLLDTWRKVQAGKPALGRLGAEGRVLEILSGLLRFHAPLTAPAVNYQLQRIEFTSNHTYDRPEAHQMTGLYRSLYDECSSTEWSGDVLISMAGYVDDFSEEQSEELWLFKAIKSNLAAYPAYWRAELLKNISEDMMQQRVELSVPDMAAPGLPLEGRAILTNVAATRLNVYDVSSLMADNDDSYIQAAKARKGRNVATVELKAPGYSAGVPCSDNVRFSLTLPRPGVYAVLPEAGSKVMQGQNNSVSVIRATRLALGTYIDKECVGVVVDPLTGKPVDGVSLMEYARKTAPVQAGITGADGMAAIKINRTWARIFPAKGTDRYSPAVYYGGGNDEEPYESMSAEGYTDLAICHPGDQIQWCFVVYSLSGRDRTLERNRPVRVYLIGADGGNIDTLSCTTDGMGRVSGKFDIPSDRLTGRYNIYVSPDDRANKQRLGSVSFMVSDYKLPQFEVKTDLPLIGSPAKGDVTVSGTVVTYSGFPLAGCRVSAALSVGRRSPWFWMRADSPVEMFTSTLTTDEQGRFNLELPESLLESSPVPNGLFTVALQAVSSTGESHDAQVTFTLGAAYNIQCLVSRSIDCHQPVKLSLNVVDSQGNKADMPVSLTLVRADGGEEVFRTVADPAECSLDWSGIGSGVYNLLCAPVGYEADTTTISDLVLYRPDDAASPVDRLLWTPDTRLRAADGTARMLLATKADTTHLLMLVSEDNKLVERRWLTFGPGMHSIAVEPSAKNERAVTLLTMNGYKSERLICTVEPSVVKPKLEIEYVTFRDRVLPGAPERWTIRVKQTTGTPAEAAVMARMYNAALDQLAPGSWGWNPSVGYVPGFSVREMPSADMMMSDFNEPMKYRRGSYDIVDPEWRAYGMGLYSGGGRIYGYRAGSMGVMRKMSAANVMADAVVEESADMDGGMMLAETVTMAPQMASARAAEAESVEDSAEEESGAGGAGQEGSNDSYRPSEIPLAFFRPMLMTDADGLVTLEFTVPDANTTWRFGAVAFTDDLNGTSTSRDIVASKPVMVAPNLPRFVRQGDRVEIRAMVMNNTDSSMTVTTRVELFDPSTGAVTATTETVSELDARGASVVTTDVKAGDAPMVGYRVRSTAGAYTDGEQALIGVLPSVTPVIDTYPFYMAPDSATYGMEVPAAGADARVTLTFCANPLWYVVTALPGLSADDDMSTPTDAAEVIYAAAVAEGLLRDNKQIADALREWSRSDRSDSTLVSMLSVNADLKNFLLQATPWMLDAASDTERMSRLALLFDSRQVRSAIAKATEKLTKLQNSDGGLRWIEQCTESSLWATESALGLFAQLEWLGYMPDNGTLRQVVGRAVKYADDKELENYRKYPEGSYMGYVFMRGKIKSVPQPSGISQMTGAMVSRAASEWKEYTLFDKGVAAILLNANGHKRTAAAVLESVGQFATYAPERGMWWPSLADTWMGSYNDLGITALLLEAYWSVQPGCEQIDRIRQWLILQKEARDWGTGIPVTTVVSTLLRSSGRWIDPAAPARIEVGGHEVKPAGVERYTGSMRADVSDMMSTSGATQVTVNRQGDTPAWGAVICQYRAEATDVKPSGCDDLTVEKNMYVSRPDGTEVKWTAGDTLRVGDRVRVELLIRAGRRMDYVAVSDARAACLEPVEQLPAPIWSEGICFYRENRNSATNIFITSLPKGSYRLTYDMWVNNAGEFTSGIASVQSQYAPQLSAHSGGSVVTVLPE